MTTPRANPPTPTTELPRLPPRPPTMHKGQAGHVAIIAGSRGMSGAAILAGLGALRAGAGLVRIYCPKSIQPVIATAEPCFMTVAVPDSPDGRFCESRSLVDAVDWVWPNAIALGPGVGLSPEVADPILATTQAARSPLVLDADGLNHLAGESLPPEQRAPADLDWWSRRKDRPTVVTPHPGEMARLRRAAGLPELKGDGDDTRLRIAHQYAALTGVTVVLKGHRTVVCTPDQAYVNTTGNPGMASGGMGDVLTGLIAALLAQGLPAFDAARLGVYVHGLAADHCAAHIAPVGFLARDVADAVPAALAEAARPRIGFK